MIKMYIGDQEVYCKSEFELSEEMLQTSSITLNNVYPVEWEDNHDYISRFYYPKDYSKFRLFKDDTLIFAGIVKNSGDLDLNPRHPHYATIQVLDFKTLLSEGEYLDFVISNKTVREAIEMVVEAIQDYGVVMGNININGADDVIGAYSCSEKSAYDVFQYLADITNSKWTTRMIDEDTIAVDFYDPNLLPKGEAIDYTSEWFNKNKIVDMHYSYGTRDYRNKQTMLSDEVFGNIPQQERLFADGYKTNYITEQKIGKINSIKVNGTNQTFTTNEQKELGVSADFYFTQKEKQFTSDKVLKAGDRIEISYLPIVNGREIVTNEVERLRVEKSLGRKGTIARYEKRNDVSSSQELSKIGQAYIRYKGSAEINLTVKTQDNELWQIGQVVDFNNAPVDELKTSYMVKSKTTHAYVNGRQSYLFYEYELSSNFNSENAINYFDNQRNKNAGNISEGEYVLRNIDLENRTWVVFYGLEVTSHEITAGDNVLNFELNGVLMK